MFYEVYGGIGWIGKLDNNVTAVLREVFSKAIGVNEYNHAIALVATDMTRLRA